MGRVLQLWISIPNALIYRQVRLSSWDNWQLILAPLHLWDVTVSCVTIVHGPSLGGAWAGDLDCSLQVHRVHQAILPAALVLGHLRLASLSGTASSHLSFWRAMCLHLNRPVHCILVPLSNLDQQWIYGSELLVGRPHHQAAWRCDLCLLVKGVILRLDMEFGQPILLWCWPSWIIDVKCSSCLGRRWTLFRWWYTSFLLFL